MHFSGIASAGWTTGFLYIFDNPFYLLLCASLGIISVGLGREASFHLPFATILMFWVGAVVQLGSDAFALMQYAFLAAVILFALLLTLVKSRTAMVNIILCGSIAFFVGSSFMLAMPNVASPGFYATGSLLSVALIIGMGITFGHVMLWDMRRAMSKVRKHPVMNSFLSLF
jgi:hydrogenase/urease accessory protein HupE